MILNLGLGLCTAGEAGDNRTAEELANGDGDGDGEMEVDEVAVSNGVDGEEGVNGESAVAGEDFGALALFDTVVEEREDRIAEEDVPAILNIIRETLTENYGS